MKGKKPTIGLRVVNETDSDYVHSWNLELRTIEPLGSILFNGDTDFIALEVVDGKLRFLVGKGSNAVELVPDRMISDGLWHNISVAYSPFLVEVGSPSSIRACLFIHSPFS